MAEPCSFLAIIPGSSELWAAIVGAISGSTISGYISYRLNTSNIQAATQEREAAKSERDSAIGYSALIKLITFSSDLHRTKEYFDSIEFISHGLTREPWEAVMPLLNPPEKTELSTDELTLIFQLCDKSLTNKILDLVRIHSALARSWQVYNENRSELANRVLVRINEVTGTSTIDPDNYYLNRQRMLHVNSIYAAMIDRIDSDQKLANEVLLEYVSAVGDRLKLPKIKLREE